MFTIYRLWRLKDYPLLRALRSKPISERRVPAGRHLSGPIEIDLPSEWGWVLNARLYCNLGQIFLMVTLSGGRKRIYCTTMPAALALTVFNDSHTTLLENHHRGGYAPLTLDFYDSPKTARHLLECLKVHILPGELCDMIKWSTHLETTNTLMFADGFKIRHLTWRDDSDEINNDQLHNEGYIVGCDEVTMGPYDKTQELVIAMFHEWGHTLITTEELCLINITDFKANSRSSAIGLWKTEIERRAWKHGLRKAKEHGIEFDMATLRYAVKSLRTYYKYNG